MGTGLYLMWPAFYTDVTDSYRLGRAGRIRTDLGGLYFNAIVAVAIMGIWWATGFDALLLVVVTQILQMVRQLMPMVRFDGYHILADATGVPDLFQRIKPTLLAPAPLAQDGSGGAAAQAVGPRRRHRLGTRHRAPAGLQPGPRWCLSLPRILGTAWDNARASSRPCSRTAASPPGTSPTPPCGSWRSSASALPVLGIFYILLRLGRQLITGLWQKTRGKALQRGVGHGRRSRPSLPASPGPGGPAPRPTARSSPTSAAPSADVTTAVFPASSARPA